MSKWRTWGGKDVGLDLALVRADMRFAGDIFKFAKSFHEIMTLLETLGLLLGDIECAKTVLITTQAQPPPFLCSSTGAISK